MAQRSRARDVRRAAAACAVAALLAAGAPLVADGARVALADEGAAKADDPVAEATKLHGEAKELFKQAGDPDAESGERGKARKAAYVKLKSARKLLDEHLKAHPEQTEALDKLYCDISMMMFWLKKELTLEDIKELQGGAPAPSTPGGTSPGGGNGEGGGIGGAGPRTPPSPGPGTAPAPGTTGPATPPTPEPPKGPTAADALAEVEAYGKEHPGDVPGLWEQYGSFLDRFPDTTSAEYGRALAARKALEDRMKDVYRLARDEDPEAIRSGSDADLKKRMDALAADLTATDVPVRARAAKYLGQLGLPEAAPLLLDALKREPSGPVADACAEGLAEIGGKKVCDKVVKAAQKDRSLGAPAVSILSKMLAKGGPAGRVAGTSLAEFACDCDRPLQAQAITALKDAGPAGALGLSQTLLTFADDEQKAALIEHVGAQKEPRTAGNLARFLVTNPTGRRRDQASAARTAIEAMGVSSVKWMIPALDEPTCSVWTAEMLRRITGTKLKDDKRKTWETWYRQNRRKLEAK